MFLPAHAPCAVAILLPEKRVCTEDGMLPIAQLGAGFQWVFAALLPNSWVQGYPALFHL
jgi:hypothetical protein